MKIGPFPCRQTDMTKLLVAFRNFANASKSDLKILVFSVVMQCSLVILQHYLGQPCCLKLTVGETFFFLPKILSPKLLRVGPIAVLPPA